MSPERANILITGAGGLVGPLLASRLLNEPHYHLTLTDLADPIVPKDVKHPENAKCIKGDITDPTFVKTLVDASQPLNAVFLFHGIMSAGSEADFDLSLRVNVDSTRLVLDTLRRTNPGVRVVYASSQAVFGQPLPAKLTPDVVPTPESTYGAHKLMTEVYVNELHRKGFIDAFIVRFPTISVRPGKPTAAASSFLSGIIREPMNGQECIVPLADRGFPSYLCSPAVIATNLVKVLHLDSGKLPKHIRHIQFPGIKVTIQEMLDSLARYGGADKLKLVKEVPDAGLEAVLRSWPQDFDVTKSLELGLEVDSSADDLVKQYVDSLKG